MKRKAKQAKETGADEAAILRAIIAEAVELNRDIAAKEERLKDCKRYLVEVAAGRTGEHLPTGNGGQSWRMEGEGGCAVNVAFPAPILRARLEGDLLALCRKMAGKLAGAMFSPIDAAKPAPDFRAAALASLGSAKGARLVALCESPAAPRVSFETKVSRNPA